MLLVALWSVMLSSLKVNVDCHIGCIWNQCRDRYLSRPGRAFPRRISWVQKSLQQGGQPLPVKADTELWMKTMLPDAFASCVRVSMCVFMSVFCMYFLVCVCTGAHKIRGWYQVSFSIIWIIQVLSWTSHHSQGLEYAHWLEIEKGDTYSNLENWVTPQRGTRVHWWLKRQIGKGMKA